MKFCIFTIIKDEQEYLDEWIQYHLNLGINYIYIYEDLFSHSHKYICDKYDNVEFKTVFDLYEKKFHPTLITRKAQGMNLQDEYMRKILNYIKDYDWVFYIDVDEYLTFENSEYKFNNVFEKFNDYQILVLYWQNYNANNHIYRPLDNKIDKYTTLCGKINKISDSKLVFNMKLFNNDMKFNHHIPKDNVKYCNTKFGNDLNDVSYDKIYIRHYFTRSFEDYIYKLFIRGDIEPGNRKLERFFELNPEIDRNSNEVQDILKKYNKYIRR